MIKKLKCLYRSLCLLIKLSPVYFLYTKTGSFNYKLDIQVASIVEDSELNPLVNEFKLDKYSDKIGKIFIDIRYMTKSQIFEYESEKVCYYDIYLDCFK